MKKLSVRKAPILGLVLIAASAVTAAVIPSGKKDSTSFAGNSLAASNDGCLISCGTTSGVVTDACAETNSDFLGGSGSAANCSEVLGQTVQQSGKGEVRFLRTC